MSDNFTKQGVKNLHTKGWNGRKKDPVLPAQASECEHKYGTPVWSQEDKTFMKVCRNCEDTRPCRSST